MALPNRVIEKDRELSKSADELMKLRWHWTLDPSNAKAVSFAEYAEAVGRHVSIIRRDANGWASYQQSLNDAGAAARIRPGAAQTPGDFRELAQHSEHRQKATEAVSRTTGKPVSTVARHHRDDINSVVNVARKRAAERGTTVEHEIEEVADWKAKAERAAAQEREERKRRHTGTFIRIDSKIGMARRSVREAFELADGVEFTSDEVEILKDTVDKLRALLNLLELRITGETPDIDWDAEFQKITE